MEGTLEITQWRTRQRAALLARRVSVPQEQRIAWNKTITRFLVEGFPCLEGMVVGFCWPFKGEFDARYALRHFRERGAVTALPVVVTKGGPLEFRMWAPDTPTTPGAFGLPAPEGTPRVRPDALLIPPIGFGSQGYRLGYGGGYFDRTLAAMTPQPVKIAVAFEVSRMPTIYPQSHDVPMDFIVTERGIHQVTPTGLELVQEARRVQTTVAHLWRQRNRRAAPGDPDTRAASTERLIHAEVIALLNTLLHAERAGAKALSAYLADYEAGSRTWLQLNSVQRDEANNCAILMDLIRGLGETPSKATGGFLQKALAVRGAEERLAFLNRGQSWVVRTIRDALPRIADPVVRPALKRMLVSHERNIGRCERLKSLR